jgi:hypothetical protein
MKLFEAIERQRKKNPNKIEANPMQAITAILTTSKGWIVRQVLKATALVTAPLAVWLESQGQGEHTAAITAGITAAVAALVEIGLSFLARKNK